ncbi:MAG: family 43 glycosylhydrolase, partial [bacterium]|nr:family 43 glycosylhydrolase [bacterium]
VWSAESAIADSALGAESAREADGRPVLFVVGTGGFLDLLRRTASGGAWQRQVRITRHCRTASAGRNADGRLELFFTGEGDSLFHMWQTSPAGEWSLPAFFGETARAASVGRNVDGRLEVFFVSGDGFLRHKWQTAPNSGWAPGADFGGLAAAVSSARNPDGCLEVFWTDGENLLRHRRQAEPSGGWADSEPFGWSASELAAVTHQDGRLEVVYRGADGVFFHNGQTEPGAFWTGERPLPSGDEPLFEAERFGTMPNIAPPRPDWHINDHCFIRMDNGGWRWYGIIAPNPDSGDPTVVDYFGQASADSVNEVPWQAQDPPFHDVLAGGGVVWAPHIVQSGGIYHMFYCGGGPLTAYAILLRTSSDLTSWSEPTVLFRDGYQARDPMVVWNEAENLWVMYYTATEKPRGGRHVVAYRTSADLARWSGRSIVYRDYHEGTAYGPTESPFVFRRGDFYYLLIGPRPYDAPTEAAPNWLHPGYAGTDVFRSARWDLWTNADYVGHIRAHAAEIVEDGEGGWRVSHAGIHQGGLYLAGLTWNDGLDAVLPGSSLTDGANPGYFNTASAYPNPFNPGTRIRFHLGSKGQVRIMLMDAAGRKVRSLMDKDHSAGWIETEWDGRDDNGEDAPSGMYLCVLRSGPFSGVLKMVLIR